jgi:hypothetical protein
MRTKQLSSDRLRRIRPTPALVVAFVALFAAMGGFGYAAVKMKPNSVKTKNIRDGAVTSNKLADGAVTTPKFASGATAPNAANAANALNAVSAANAEKLGGVAPGHCQLGWLKASAVIDTGPLTDANPDMDVSGFDCASSAEKPVHVHRLATGRYEVTIAGIGSGTSISSSANVGGPAANIVTAASSVEEDVLTLNVWTNADLHVANQPDGNPPLVDGKTVTLLVF